MVTVVPLGSLPRHVVLCLVRVLLLVNTSLGPRDLRHVYLGAAKSLRPDWGMDDEELASVLARTADSVYA